MSLSQEVCAFHVMKLVAITAAVALAAFLRPTVATFWGEGKRLIECHLPRCYLALMP